MVAVKIGVLVPCLKYFKGAVEVIESVRTEHEWEPYIAPNWRKNWPLSKAWNIGVAKLLSRKCDYILICNDDIILSPLAIDNLVDFFENVAPDNVVLASGRNMRGRYSDPYSALDYYPVQEEFDYPDHPDFSCFMIRKDTRDLVGLFDENFIPAYFEDNDYHRRINLLGYRGVNYGGAGFFHIGSVTQNLDPDSPAVPSSVFDGNRQYYIDKWGGDPGRETFTSPYDEGGDPREWRRGARRDSSEDDAFEDPMSRVDFWISQNLK